LLPKLSNRQMDSYLKEAMEEDGAIFFDIPSDRPQALKVVSESITLKSTHSISPETLAEFHALSYTYLQMELICRQLRYSDGVDQERFQKHLLLAAKSVTSPEPNQEVFLESLQSCYDLLADQRQRFYPADPLITDLTLTGPTTGLALKKQIANWHGFSLQTTAENLNVFKTQHSAAFGKLK